MSKCLESWCASLYAVENYCAGINAQFRLCADLSRILVFYMRSRVSWTFFSCAIVFYGSFRCAECFYSCAVVFFVFQMMWKMSINFLSLRTLVRLCCKLQKMKVTNFNQCALGSWRFWLMSSEFFLLFRMSNWLLLYLFVRKTVVLIEYWCALEFRNLY